MKIRSVLMQAAPLSLTIALLQGCGPATEPARTSPEASADSEAAEKARGEDEALRRQRREQEAKARLRIRNPPPPE